MNQNKNLKSFWAILMVFVVGMVAGGVVYAVSYNNILDDEINAMSFFRHKDGGLRKTLNDKNSDKAFQPGIYK